MKKVLSLFLSVMLLLLLAGCSETKNAPNPTEAQVTRTETATEKLTEAPVDDLTQTPTEKQEDKIDGPLVFEGSTDNFNLYQVDIHTGKMHNVFSYTNNNQFSFSVDLNPDYLPAYLRKQLFSSDLDKLAVNWIDSHDGSKHVGWVNNSGTLTDITNKVHPSSNSFSSKVPNDTNALFAPSGDFFFCDLNSEKYYYVDPNTLSIVKEEEAIESDNGYKIYDVVFHWDHVGADFSESGSESSKNVEMGDFAINVEHDKDVLKAYDFAGKSSLLVGVRVNKNTSLIGEYGEGIKELNRYNAYSVIWNNPIFRQITPDTDYVIEDCAYNNNLIAFTAHRGDSRYLFIIEDKEDSEPQTVTSLDKKYMLFFWS